MWCGWRYGTWSFALARRIFAPSIAQQLWQMAPPSRPPFKSGIPQDLSCGDAFAPRVRRLIGEPSPLRRKRGFRLRGSRTPGRLLGSNGGRIGTRTPDISHVKRTLYQLSYASLETTRGHTCCPLAGDPYGTRTRVAAVKGRSLNRLTNGPCWQK